MANQNEDDVKKEINEKIRQLKESKFKQQMLPAWRPVPSFGSTMITFGVFGVVFLGLGIMLYVLSDKIQEVQIPYDADAYCQAPNANAKLEAVGDRNATVNGYDCNVQFTLDTDFTGNVFVYYQLDNFYQNHRRYVKSRDYKQLMGDTRTIEQIKTPCDPIVYNKDLLSAGINKTVSGISFDTIPDEPAIPCGLIAKSLFNDSYEVWANNLTGQPDVLNVNITIDDSSIAWESDKEYKFKNQDPPVTDERAAGKWQNIQWIDITNQHFIVWMRTAGLPNFRKLYGRLDTGSSDNNTPNPLKAGTYTVKIKNNYNVKEFQGKKYFVLSTTNMLGGQNYFLAVCYIVVGALCIVFAIIFFVAYVRKAHLQTSQREGQTN